MTVFLYIMVVLIWGTTYYAITLQLGEVPPLQSVFYRFALAAVLMWILALSIKARVHFERRLHLLFAGYGLLMFSLNYVVVYHATAHLVSGLVSVIFSLMVLFNTLFSWLLLGERPSKGLVTGGLFGLFGLTALFFDDIYGLDLNEAIVYGIGLSLLSTLLASGGNMVAQLFRTHRLNVISCNCWGMTYGSLYLFIAILLTGDPWRFPLQPAYIGSLLYLSIAGTVIAFWAYVTLIHRIGAPRAAYLSGVFPLVAILMSTLYEQMHWTPSKLIGMVLIIAGNLFIIQRKQAGEQAVQQV